MVAKTYIKQDGTWNEAGNILVKENGEWVDIKTAWVKQGGVWKQFFESGSSTPVSPSVIPPSTEPPRSLLFEASKQQSIGHVFGNTINPIKWTFSGWVKRGITGTAQTVFCGGLEGTGVTQDSVDILFTASNQIEIRAQIDDSITWQIRSNESFTDPTLWYNIVISYDSANPTASERVKMHINGITVTVFSVNTQPTLNESALINLARPTFYGKLVDDGLDIQYFDGYMAEDVFVDGEALLPTSFGAFTSWLWRKIDFVEAVGTNGYNLDYRKNEIDTNITASEGDVGTNPSTTPNNAKDGDPSTTFITVSTPASNDVILNYNLGSPKTVTEVHVIGYHQIAVAADVSFRVEFSSDNFVGDINIFDVAKSNTPVQIAQDHILTDIATARFWRIIADQNHDNPVEITAFRLFDINGIGNDTSTNTNNYSTIENFTATDQTYDHPLSNHVTLNPNNKSANSIIERGRLTVSSVTPAPANAHGVLGTTGVDSGKWYYEVSRIVVGSTGRSASIGFAEFDTDLDLVAVDLSKVFVYSETGNKLGNGASVAYGNAWGSSNGDKDTIGIALDMDNGTLEFFKNGITQGVAFSSGISGKTLYPVILINNGGGTTASKSTWEMDPGTFGFRHAVPSGFKAITQQNIGKLNNSILFNPSSLPSLSRAQTVPTEESKWTFSTWIKLGDTTPTNVTLLGSTSSQDSISIQSDKIQVNFNGGSVMISSAIFVDTTAWYHIVVRWDGLNPIVDEKIRIYVNGIELTEFDVDQRNLIAANGFESKINKNGETIFVGSVNGTLEHFDGYMAETTFIDGQSLPPESFGSIDPTTGVWGTDEFRISNPGPITDETAGGLAGTVTSDSDSLPASNVVDDDLNTHIDKLGSSMFTSFDFGVSNEKVITSYSVTAVAAFAFTVNSVASAWTLEASNTGVFGGEEVILDTVTGQTWFASEKKVFTLDNLNAFRHYRLNITANGGGSNVRIAEFELLTSTPVPGAITAFGNNGFYLRYHDKDNIGLNTIVVGNEFTPTNLDSEDVTKDSPFNNYCVWNTLELVDPPLTYSNGNLNLSIGVASSSSRGTFGVSSGKWYWECSPLSFVNGIVFGIVDSDADLTLAGRIITTPSYFYESSPSVSLKSISGVGTAYGTRIFRDDIIGIELDLDGSTIEFYKNGVSQGIIPITEPAGTVWFPSTGSTAGSDTWNANFGQRPFKFPIADGFARLNTDSLPESNVINSGEFFKPILYTGNGSSQEITGFGFSPDLTWAKPRNLASNNLIFDTSRGPTKRLITDASDVESIQANELVSFDANGFTVGNGNAINQTSIKYVSWNWDESPASGFDILSYTGNATAGRLISHTLGKAPEFMIVKSRTAGRNWLVWHTGFPGITSTDYLMLDLAISLGSAGTSNTWNNTLPTSTDIVLGADSNSNGLGEDYILYSWTSVDGFSKFGSYDGNGNADGPFVHCGFKPAYVLSKRVNTGGDWTLYDNAIHPFNGIDSYLEPNNFQVEAFTAGFKIDFTSNGFKIRGNAATVNANGDQYIFAAFAETPFKTATAR